MGSRLAALVERGGLWPLRLLWLGLPVVYWLELDTLLNGLRWPLAAESVLWVAWFLGLMATLVPGPVSLTALRILAPAAVATLVMAAAFTGHWTPEVLVGLGYGLIVSALAMLPVIGDLMINGSAYGSERRMGLRPPGFALAGPVELTWLAMFAGVAAPVVSGADGRWAVFAPTAVVGAVVCWMGWRILHQLSRRWLVFVPAGFVIHDPVLLIESVLARRSTVASLGPALADDLDRATDLSGKAPGLALEVVLTEPTSFARRQGKQAISTEADRIVFAPTLPGAVLREARLRAIHIDTPAA